MQCLKCGKPITNKISGLEICKMCFDETMEQAERELKKEDKFNSIHKTSHGIVIFLIAVIFVITSLLHVFIFDNEPPLWFLILILCVSLFIINIYNNLKRFFVKKFKASKEWNEILSLGALANYATELGEKGKYEEQVKEYEELLKGRALTSIEWYRKGHAHDSLSQFKKALYCYDRALHISPQFAEANNNKGIILINSGKRKEGIALLKKAADMGFVLAKENLKKLEIS
jgi:tetratricopeptide (TPR) repeat protein